MPKKKSFEEETDANLAALKECLESIRAICEEGSLSDEMAVSMLANMREATVRTWNGLTEFSRVRPAHPRIAAWKSQLQEMLCAIDGTKAKLEDVPICVH